MGGSTVKTIKLRSSGVVVKILQLPSKEVESICGCFYTETRLSYQRQVINYFCDNYLSDVIPDLVGKDTDYRKKVFSELYKAIVQVNPSVEQVTAPKKGDLLDDMNIPFVLNLNFDTSSAAKSNSTNKVEIKVQKEKVKGLSKALSRVVYGQEEALRVIQEYFECSMVGMGDPDRPRGSFIFVGDTGTGKTMTVKEIAKYLFGKHWRNGLFIINGSELMAEHESARLLGSPQGYVGYDDGSAFLKHMSANPESIVLVDEFEKAHPKMQDVFLQILDEGACYDNRGRRIDFSKSFIIFTSNIGTKEVYHKNKVGFGEISKSCEAKSSVTSALNKFCRVEFLKRFDGVVTFNLLEEADYKRICEAQIRKIVEKVKAKGITISVNRGVSSLLVTKMEEGDTSRDLKTVVKRYIEVPIARELIANDKISSLVISSRNGEITIEGVYNGEKEKGCDRTSNR